MHAWRKRDALHCVSTPALRRSRFGLEAIGTIAEVLVQDIVHKANEVCLRAHVHCHWPRGD